MSNAQLKEADFHSYYQVNDLRSYIRENSGIRHIYICAHLTWGVTRWVQISQKDAMEMLITLPLNTLLPAECMYGSLWLGR